MLGASLYILVCSARNRVRIQLRRLRQPRYMVGAIAAAAYLYFTVFLRIGARRGPRRNGGPDVSAGPLRSMVLPVGSAAMVALAALAWVFPASSSLFEFSDAETNLLFPAPVSRRQLLIHRLIRSQIGFLFASFIAAFFVTAPMLSATAGLGSAASRLMRMLAFWVVLPTARMYFAGATQARARLGSSDRRARAAAWAPLLLVLAGFVTIVVPLVRSVMTTSRGAFPDIAARFGEVTAQGAPRLAALPFALLLRPFLVDSPAQFFTALAGALAVFVVVSEWVLRSDGIFQDAGESPRPRKAERNAAAAIPSTRNFGWILPLLGRTETIFLWKNGMSTIRLTQLMSVLPLVIPLIALTFGVSAGLARGESRGLLSALSVGALMAAAVCTLLGPMTIRTDLRGDLQHLDLLKTWPLKAAALIRGELLWPTMFLTACAWLALACGTILASAAFPGAGLTARLSLAATAMLLAPALIGSQFTVHNAVAVVFPAWVPTGRQRSRGLDAMGQRLIMFGGVLIALIVMVGPGAIAGGLVAFAFYRFGGTMAFVPGAIVCLSLVAIEIVLVTEMLGAAYERIDLSQVERSE